MGFYGSGITMDKARAAVEALQEQKQQAEGKTSAPTADLPFGRDSKRIFESAAEARPKHPLRYHTLRSCLLHVQVCRHQEVMSGHAAGARQPVYNNKEGVCLQDWSASWVLGRMCWMLTGPLACAEVQAAGPELHQPRAHCAGAVRYWRLSCEGRH